MAEENDYRKVLMTLRTTPPTRRGGTVVHDAEFDEIQRQRKDGEITDEEADLLIAKRINALIAEERAKQDEFTNQIMAKIEQYKKEHFANHE